MSDYYLIPGLFDGLPVADEQDLHQGGLDYGAIRHDAPDDFNAQLPQFGPQFVQYTAERFDALQARIERQMKRWQFAPVTAIFVATMNTNGAGAIGIENNDKAELYQPPPGFTFALHRLTIRNEANNFGTPYTAASSWWEIRIDNEMVDGNPMVANQGQLPVVASWGTRDAPHIRDGEVLSFFMSGGPATQKITIRGQGTLDRTAEG